MLATGQVKDTLTKKLDSLASNPDSSGGKQKNVIAPSFYNENTRITPRVYIILTLDDMKQQWTSPFRATKKNWLQVGMFAALTTGVVLGLDKPVNRYTVEQIRTNRSAVSASLYVTNFGGWYETYTLAALGAYGWIFKRDKEKTTTLLATQAYITGAAVETVMKFLTSRQRPSYYDALTGRNSHVFHGPFYHFMKSDSYSYQSFPSGHTTVAFAAATVFAMEYKNIWFVPIISYSAATAIGLSRVVQNAHWISDVLVGAGLGFITGRQVVNNYHRYSKLQMDKAKKKHSVSFTLDYLNGTMTPGIVYTFR
ncbi:MAG TPA: phosphatase PAP2 family protein [Puia sp.]|nr:phosphatase PAP2 family protein [Puia sp.]